MNSENKAKRQTTRRQLAEPVHQIGGVAAALALISDGVTVSDPYQAGEPISYVNRAFLAITGYTEDECRGHNWSILFGAETDPAALAKVRGAVARRKPVMAELLCYRKDGTTFWNRIRFAPVLDVSGEATALVTSHSDVTALKNTRRALLAATAQSDSANRVKTNFLAHVSHELRTPLNAIVGFSETMQAELFGALSPRYREYVTDIHNSGLHLLELINDILDFAKSEAQKVELKEETFAVEPVIAESIRLVKLRAETSQIRLTMALSDSLPRLHADQRRVKQIVLNLISNGVKFTPPGGEVLVTADLEPDGEFLFSVVDSGLGLKPEQVSKAIEPFGQVKNSLSRERGQEGTGLGLPLTKRLIELHGGSLELLSRPSAGTIMNVRFPAERVVA
jgi:PAS domain S-box-containing protein